MKSNTKPNGFTLIELLIVIFITALIAGISIANFRKGERSQRVTISYDTVVGALQDAQNFALTSKEINGSACGQGTAPASYLLMFTASSTMTLYGVDKCGTANQVQTYTLTGQTQFQANGYKLGGVAVSTLQIRFDTPFAKVTASTNTTPNSGPFSAFISATIAVQSSDTSVTQTVNLDGLTGRIGQ